MYILKILRVHEFTVQERIMENIISITTIKQVIDKTIKVKVNKIVSPRDVSLLVHSLIGDSDREYFLVIHVSTKNIVNSVDIAHIGSLNTCTIHPREILKGAILSNSAAIVLCHIGMKNQWRNYNLLYPQCYINFAFFLMAKLSLKVGWR